MLTRVCTNYRQCTTRFFRRSVGITAVLWCAALFAIPVAGWAESARSPSDGSVASEAPPPTVMLITSLVNADADEELYRAIRAQLSGAPIHLDRFRAESVGQDEAARHTRASAIVDETGASMVLWIEDEVVARTFYYIPETDGGRIIERTLELEASTGSSRIELIAVAVASMVEKLLVTHQIPPAPPPKTPKPPPPEPPKPEPPPRQWARAEIWAAYAGIYFSEKTFGHGGTIGVGVFPLYRLAITAAYSQFAPVTVKDTNLELSLTPRLVEVSAAARLVETPLDIRLGLAVVFDIRSHDARRPSASLQQVRDNVRMTVSLMPYASLTWFFAGRIGMVARAGASIGVTEADYDYNIDGDSTVLSKPFTAKLQIVSGLIVKI